MLIKGRLLEYCVIKSLKSLVDRETQVNAYHQERPELDFPDSLS